ncbi:MAG: tryptophan synthase subunit alpha [Chitinivibrionales bacterium]|nr:tryptophan synthase subunit alpha [Chitinivibrionales bacterium]MBD3357756.1 tryptophan synthase subunit alpha [Chitinivibrionales bacterium]
MNRYEQSFASTARDNRIAFIPFAVAGDPYMRLSEKIFRTYIDAGADILEIGYPFSDPMADGPVNQRAAQRALEAGITPDSFFAMLSNLRRITDIPFGLLLYANTVHHLGYETFCARAADAGVDSILVADMPPEESGDFLAALQKNSLKSVFIVSELTPTDRAEYICEHSSGFVYVVSRLGTTGVQTDFSGSVHDTLSRLRGLGDKRLCVGFGLSTPDHVRRVKEAGADGAIVGSALVKIIEAHHGQPESDMLQALHHAVGEFRSATQ